MPDLIMAADMAQAVVAGTKAYVAGDAGAGAQDVPSSQPLVGKLGQVVFRNDDGSFDTMSFMSGGKQYLVSFKPGTNFLDMQTIMDSAGNTITLKDLAGSVSKMGPMRSYINACLQNAISSAK